MPRGRKPQMWRHEVGRVLRVKRELLEQYLQKIFKDDTLRVFEGMRSKPENRVGRFPSAEIAKEFHTKYDWKKGY